MTLYIIQGEYDCYNLVNLKTDNEYTDYGDSILDIHSVDENKEQCLTAIKDKIVDTFGTYSESRLKVVNEYPIVKEAVLTDNTGF